jgi:hypothetical protein
MVRKSSILLFLLLAVASVSAQTSTQGKEFWLSFMLNGYEHNYYGGWVHNCVMISARHNCSGTITNPRTGWSESFTIESARVKFVGIPDEQAYNVEDETVADKGLLLVTTDTVSVYTASCAQNSFDATFVLPIESLGSEYIVQTDAQSKIIHEEISNQFTSAFLVVATEDNTRVEITPSVKTITGHEAYHPFSVTLDAGQTYSVRSEYGEGAHDLSGSKVKASSGKKIAVFNGNTLTTVPDIPNGGLDHIFEQAQPTFAWGRHFAVTTSNGRARDFVKVTSSADGNVVKKNGHWLTELRKGESYVFDLRGWDGSCYLETSEPSVVYLYNTTFCDELEPVGNDNGDPSMVWIPPVELKIDEITFCTFDHGSAPIDHHYVNIVVERKDIRRVYLDNQLMDPDDFRPVAGNHQYYYTRKWIAPGIHHLRCRMGLMAHVYGFGEVKGYAYCVGSNIIDLRSQLYVNETPSEVLKSGYYACVDDTLRFNVETNYEIRNVLWDFADEAQAQGQYTTHTYTQIGDYEVTAFIEGINTFNQQPVSESKSVMVHVGESDIHDETHVLCDVDVFDYYGVEYSESGYYERLGVNVFGCDSSYYLHLDMNFSPDFEIVGESNPIGGSETHIGIYDYTLRFDDARTQVDTVLWQVDCPNWRIVPQGHGEGCKLYIHTLSLQPVLLHATAINRCDTVRHDFALQTTYFDLPDKEDLPVFEVSPNPSDGHLVLHFGELSGNADVEVYNSMGQKTGTFSVDLDSCKEMGYVMPDHNNGLYIFVLKNNGRTFIRKVAVVR